MATVLLGAAAVADVLYLNIRDRAAELATLRATGWTDAALGRLVGYEGFLLGVLGAVTGAGLGLGGAAWLVGELPAALVLGGRHRGVGRGAGHLPGGARPGRAAAPPAHRTTTGRGVTMDATTGSTVRTAGLVRQFRTGAERLTAIDDVSLEIAAGSVVALTGPSGSGKSTLLHLIGAIERADRGTVTVDEVEVTALRRAALARYRQRVGFVFQRYHLLPALTVLDNVIAPVLPQPRGAPTTRRGPGSCSAAVGLAGRERALPAQLSGGQQQRVAIARALMGAPRLLLADEPTGNLDSTTGAQILDLLLDLRDRHGMTIMLATHEQAIAARCDRLIRLERRPARRGRRPQRGEDPGRHVRPGQPARLGGAPASGGGAGGADLGGDPLGDLAGRRLGGRLDHHPDQRLGARRAQQHPAGLAQLGLGPLHRGAARPARAAPDGPVATGTLISTCGSSVTTEASSARDLPVAAIRAIRCSAGEHARRRWWRTPAGRRARSARRRARARAARSSSRTYRSPTLVSTSRMPCSRIARCRPRLLITVATRVSSVSSPASRIARARIAMIWSPSTSRAVGVDRQAAVGVAVVGDAQVARRARRTAARSASRWVRAAARR